jgi:hypothetical protein
VVGEGMPSGTIELAKYVIEQQYWFDALTDNGLSADQLQAVKRSLYSYSVLAKQDYWTMTLVS